MRLLICLSLTEFCALTARITINLVRRKQKKSLLHAVRGLGNLILDEGPETIAAFFAGLNGGGRCHCSVSGYFDKIQLVLKKYDILMVADEVICGFGRTGNMWGSQTLNIRPDLLTCAKLFHLTYLPISAVLISGEIYDICGVKVGNLVFQSRIHLFWTPCTCRCGSRNSKDL